MESQKLSINNYKFDLMKKIAQLLDDLYDS